MERTEPRRHLPPDALFFIGVQDDRRSEMIQAMVAADTEEGLAPFDVRGVVQSGVPGLELEMVHVGRIRIDVIWRDRRAGLRLVHGHALQRAPALRMMMFSEARTMKVYLNGRRRDDRHPLSA